MRAFSLTFSMQQRHFVRELNQSRLFMAKSTGSEAFSKSGGLGATGKSVGGKGGLGGKSDGKSLGGKSGGGKGGKKGKSC
jgi:hypothetical protein